MNKIFTIGFIVMAFTMAACGQSGHMVSRSRQLFIDGQYYWAEISFKSNEPIGGCLFIMQPSHKLPGFKATRTRGILTLTLNNRVLWTGETGDGSLHVVQSFPGFALDHQEVKLTGAQWQLLVDFIALGNTALIKSFLSSLKSKDH